MKVHKSLNVQLNGEIMDELDYFRYQEVDLSSNGGMKAEMKHIPNESGKVVGASENVRREMQPQGRNLRCIME